MVGSPHRGQRGPELAGRHGEAQVRLAPVGREHEHGRDSEELGAVRGHRERERLRVQGSGFRIQGVGIGYRVQGIGYRVQGQGYRV